MGCIVLGTTLQPTRNFTLEGETEVYKITSWKLRKQCINWLGNNAWEITWVRDGDN